MLLQLEKARNQQENRGFHPPVDSLRKHHTTNLSPYAVKAAHLAIKWITREILLITDCIWSRLTFPFQIRSRSSGQPSWGYHTTSACAFRSSEITSRWRQRCRREPAITRSL